MLVFIEDEEQQPFVLGVVSLFDLPQQEDDFDLSQFAILHFVLSLFASLPVDFLQQLPSFESFIIAVAVEAPQHFPAAATSVVAFFVVLLAS